MRKVLSGERTSQITMPVPMRSISLFMTASDEEQFVDFVKSTGDVVFLSGFSKTAEFEPLVGLKIKDAPSLASNIIYILNRSVSARFVTIPPIQGNGELSEFYHLDEDNSSVARFWRCDREPGVVFGGWLDVLSCSLTADFASVLKEPGFLKWYESIRHWIRRNYTKLTGTKPTYWAGPEAGKLFDEGSLDLVLQRGDQELFVEGNLSSNRESWRRRKGA